MTTKIDSDSDSGRFGIADVFRDAHRESALEEGVLAEGATARISWLHAVAQPGDSVPGHVVLADVLSAQDDAARDVAAHRVRSVIVEHSQPLVVARIQRNAQDSDQ